MKKVKINLNPPILHRACGGGFYILKRKNPGTDKIEYNLGFEVISKDLVVHDHCTVISKEAYLALKKESEDNHKKYVVREPRP